MKKIVAVLVYTALSAGAIMADLATARPANADMTAVAELRSGDMKKLVIHAAPELVPSTAFNAADGSGEITLEAFRGKFALVNFWATWCAPCRKEMPQLSELQTLFGGDRFEVVTIATGRNSPTGIVKFFEEIGVDNLPRYQDPKQSLAREMGIFGLPITVLIDPEGREVARLRGDADWASDSAKAIISAVLETKTSG